MDPDEGTSNSYFNGALTKGEGNSWTMNDFVFESTSNVAVGIADNGTLNFSGTNTITAKSGTDSFESVAIEVFGGGNMTLSGAEGASLTAQAGNVSDDVYCISAGISATTLTVEGAGKITAIAGEATGDGSCTAQGISAVVKISEESALKVVKGEEEKPESGVYTDREIVIANPSSTPAPEPEPEPIGATIGGLTGTSNNVSITTANGETKVSTISMGLLDEIANNVSNGKDIVLDVSKAENSGAVTKVTLTRDTIANVAEVLQSSINNKESLVIKTNTSTVQLDANALAAVVDQASADDIQIVVENKAEANLNSSQQAAVATIANAAGKEVVQTFEAYITSGGNKILDLNGGEVTVGKVDIKVESGKKAENYKVYAISENGELKACETWVVNGAIMFKTGTLASYVLVYDANL